MRNELIRSRFFFVVLMFLFLFFQQWMGLLVEPITIQFSQAASVLDRWINTILPVHVIFAMVFLPIWGVLFDRHTRKRVLSLAGFLWGVSAWLMGIAPTFPTYNISRVLSGMASAGYSGIYAMVGDLFKPTNRGKVFSLLLLAQPLAIILLALMPNFADSPFGWRPILLFFGAIAFLLTIAIQLFIKEPKRGAKEPALADIPITGTYLLETDIALKDVITPSLLLIFLFIFLGTIPVYVLLVGMGDYLRNTHGLQPQIVLTNMLPAMVGVLLGYPLGGVLGDFFFRYKKNGRLFTSLLGLVIPTICLYRALQMQDVLTGQFLLFMLLVSVFMAFGLPNLMASIMDVALPETRATVGALGLFFQSMGIFIAPMIFSWARVYLSIGDAMLVISIAAWMLCLLLCVGLIVLIPKDIEHLRRHMAYRGHLEARLAKSKVR
jgi:MFS family permease